MNIPLVKMKSDGLVGSTFGSEAGDPGLILSLRFTLQLFLPHWLLDTMLIEENKQASCKLLGSDAVHVKQDDLVWTRVK